MSKKDPSAPKRPYRARWPEASYGPEWRELWLRASREAFHYDFPSKADLTRTRMRAQHFRNQQKELDRPGWQLLYRATTTIDPINPCRLLFRPVEDPHRTFFKDLGIVAERTQSTPLAPGEGTVAASPFDADDFMEKLLREKGEESDGN